MKTFDDLANRIKQWEKNIDNNIMEAQKKTAQKMWEDVIIEAPMKTGEYINSIKIEGPEKEGSKITTFIGSGLNVGPTKSGGKFYNLGYLLEHGTFPHDIFPVDKDYLVFEIDGKIIRTKHVHHPGSIGYPHYELAIIRNKKLYKDNIKLSWRKK